MVVKVSIEPKLEPYFLNDSYGYRPNKSAIQALGVTRKRCWRKDWVFEFDIKGLFDNISHDYEISLAIDKQNLYLLRLYYRCGKIKIYKVVNRYK